MRPLPLGLILLAPFMGMSVLAAAPAASHPLSLKERAELLPVICQGAVSGGGCLRCPPGSSEVGEVGPLEATAVVYGRFLNARQTNALVDLSGCEPHVTNFGATALLRWDGLTRWTLMKYLPGYRTDRCSTFAGRDGRDRSVCETYYANMGTVLSGLGFFDWARPDSARSLLSLESNLESCLGPEVHDLRLTGWMGQTSSLVVRVSAARTRLPATQRCGDPVKLPAARRYTLTWRWTGDQFVPTLATRKVISRLQVRP